MFAIYSSFPPGTAILDSETFPASINAEKLCNFIRAKQLK